MTLLDSNSFSAGEARQSRSIILLGVLAAVVVTSVVFFGYSTLRKRHQQGVIAAQQVPAVTTNEPKGPPKVQILVDDALTKGDQSLLGGTVKNISEETLSDLRINLELIRRKDGGTDKISAAVEPKELSPQQEGRYSLQLHAADYVSVRLAGLKSGSSPELLAYLAGPGQKRPAERLQGRTIIVTHPSSRGGFLNTPDSPGKVP